MTTPPETTTEALQVEIEALRTKNVELLAELKTAKAAAKEAQDALATLQGERDAAVADVRALRLDGPVARVLDEVAVDPELFRTLWDKHYTFALDDAGAVAIFDKDGNVATVTEGGSTTTGGNRRGKRPETTRVLGKERPARFTAEDVRLLCDASPDKPRFDHVLRGFSGYGGGAVGNYNPRALAAAVSATTDTPAAPSPFGLR